MAIFDPGKETELHVDASAAGFGATLMQKQPDGKFHPVSYFSQATTPAESRYHSFELETLGIVYGLRRYRVYLEGRPFVIVTDCNSLRLTLEKRSLNARIARWALELSPYSYTIKHRPGASMGHVDTLSRSHKRTDKERLRADSVTDVEINCSCQQDVHVCRDVHAIDEEEANFHVRVTQTRDPKIISLRQKLETGPVEKFDLIDGLVFRVNVVGKPQLYIPEEMVENVIRMTHEKVGHMAVDKTYDQMRIHYWCPNMRPRIESHIGNCIKCIMYAAPVRIRERNLHSIEKKPIPYDTVHLDHFGPLPAIKSKRKHVLVAADAFTKLTKLYPVISTSTREVLACLEKYFKDHDRPRRVVVDQASCFTALEFTEKMKEWNIDVVKVAVGSPQANGQVERVNRVLKAMLGKITEPLEHADWVARLDDVEYALNNTKSRSTGFSPRMLLVGQNQRRKVPDEMTEFIENEYHAPTPIDLKAVRTTAADNIRKSQKYNEDYHEIRRVPVRHYSVGDLVVMTNVDVTVGTNKKFVPKYRGPYKIDKVLPHDRYVVKDVEGCQLTQRPYNNVIEAARLRRWVRNMSDVEAIIGRVWSQESNTVEHVIGSIIKSDLVEL